MNGRINELEQEIRRHQDLYYRQQPEISDAQFDALWDELRRLDPENELFQTVGSDLSSGYPKRAHLIPMNSQDKASSPEAFLKWAARVEHERYIVQHKLDGASLELQYRNGKFQYGVTRGDGHIGDDITSNVRRMQGVVEALDVRFTGGVRGEVIMRRRIHQTYYPDKANCRNAANGLMKRKDGKGSEHLLILCYDAASSENELYFADETAKLSWLQEQGFQVVSYRECDSAEEVVDAWAEVMDERDSMDFDIDGLVVKGNTIDHDDLRRSRPEKQIAFKFSLEEETTTLRQVIWSESGHLYTPIGVTDPVRLAGTTVKRANLVHPLHIEEMNLKIGSRVVITKRGEIIPKIERLVDNPPDALPIELPQVCGTCGTALVNEGTRLYCPNNACPKRRRRRIERWIEVLGVRDFGGVLIGRLFDAGRVRKIADLYSLKEEDIVVFERMGEGIARKALRNLFAVQEVSLPQFVAGFNIEGIAQLLIGKLVDAGFDTLPKLLDASPEELAAVDGIGEITARTICEGLKQVREEMEALLATGAVHITAPTEGGRLAGASFCFTGALRSITRAEAEARVVEAGGTAKSSVTTGLTYLVTNDPESGSSKLRKAEKLGVKVISEDEFLSLLG